MAQLIDAGNGELRLTGQINFQSVPELWSMSRRIFPRLQSSSVCFDVEQITQIDSGGLAFLVSWARWANFYGKQFYLTGNNTQLSALIESNQLQSLLHQQS